MLLLNPFTFDFTTIDWRTVSVLTAVIGILLALYFQWWRNRKRLSYKVLSDVVLISAEKEIEDKVEIHFEGHSVKNVRLLLIKLINDGYQPIKKDDFERSVEFVFPDAKILTAEKVKFFPDNLGTQMAYRDEKLEIDPALFNRKDYIKFKVLLSGFKTLKVDARIVGVSRVAELKTSSFKSTFGLLLFTAGFQFGLIGLLEFISDIWVTTLSVTVVGIFSASLAWYLLKDKKSGEE